MTPVKRSLKPTLEEIEKAMLAGTLLEVTQERLELKSSWHQEHGKDISAIANHESFEGGWLIIGVNDDGNLLAKNDNWLKETEQQVSSHIQRYLVPTWSAKNVVGRKYQNGCCIIVEIINSGDVTDWNGKSYNLTGTVSQEITPSRAVRR